MVTGMCVWGGGCLCWSAQYCNIWLAEILVTCYSYYSPKREVWVNTQYMKECGTEAQEERETASFVYKGLGNTWQDKFTHDLDWQWFFHRFSHMFCERERKGQSTRVQRDPAKQENRGWAQGLKKSLVRHWLLQCPLLQTSRLQLQPSIEKATAVLWFKVWLLYFQVIQERNSINFFKSWWSKFSSVWIMKLYRHLSPEMDLYNPYE